MQKWLIGVDEVGRGPLAGPVAVGVACVPAGFAWRQLPGVTDSKQLTEAKREEIFKRARELQQAGALRYEVSLVSAKVIDRIGIVPAINLAMDRALQRLTTKKQNTSVNWGILPSECTVKLDGGLRAPERFGVQETIIKGDARESIIGLASIMAKVTRDRYMTRLAKRAAHTPYNFHIHKGYGTKAHRAAISKYGLSDQHRKSFCRSYVPRSEI
ncbi:ribonuclease HII [bacterium]|nr:ribonuclease HII [bacterium]|tara:strand:+ start:1107 stop:1748 length:642 start_codon:yes stop_codon:yes gene_type:complete